jgi:23S rRNA (adenine1618-N6)-methyltransferase
LSAEPKPPPQEKSGLHPRNRHGLRYDFPTLTACCPELRPLVQPHPCGGDTVDFSDPHAVKVLNRALLKTYYGVAEWDIPPGYLCPPIPGRADYIHHVADLIAEAGSAPPRGPHIVVLDVGVGANCVYPIIGVSEYGWRFVGTDIDPVALESARHIVAVNPHLVGKVECRLQRASAGIFGGVVRPGETFAASVCNPPFHASAEEAAAGTLRKLRNLGAAKANAPVLNFGGRATELWCEGGESAFVRRMITESATRPGLCRWFTTLVSKSSSLPALYHSLKAVRAAEVKTIELAHGQKKSRLLAWRFSPAGDRGGKS